MRNLIKNVVLSKALVNVASPAIVATIVVTIGGGGGNLC